MDTKRWLSLSLALAIAIAGLVLAALAFGSGGIQVTAADSPLPTPEVPTPTVTISVTIRGDLPGFQTETVICVDGADPTAWHLLFFGDEEQTGAEPFGWQMAEGCTSPISHMYETSGQYDPEAHVVSIDGETHVYTYVLVIPERPYGELQLVKVGPESPNLFDAVVTTTNTCDWCAGIVSWGHGGAGAVYFPGTGGTYTVSHSIETGECEDGCEVVLEVGSDVYAPYTTSQTISFMPAPTGTWTVEADVATFGVTVTVDWSDTQFWGTCVWWNAEESICFEQTSGMTQTMHTFPGYGTYPMTLTLENPDWLPVVLTETVEFVESPELPVTGAIQIEIIDFFSLEVRVTGTFSGSVKSACVLWGDQSQFCTPGLTSPFSATHVYAARGVFPAGLVVFGPSPENKTLIVQEVDLRPKQVYLPLAIR